MRGLLAAVAGMGVLIVAGTVALAVLVAGRAAGHGAAPAITLDEPAGTAIVAARPADADRVLVQLRGGGPDRVVAVDLRMGRVAARLQLAR